MVLYIIQRNGCEQSSGIVKYKTGPNSKDEFVSCSINEIKRLEYATNDECSGTSHSNQNKIQYSVNTDKNGHQTSTFKICTDISGVIYLEDSTNKVVSKDDFNKCNVPIKKYEINENGTAFAFSCGNYNENNKANSGYSGYYLLNDQLYNCISSPNINTISSNCYKLIESDSINEIKVFKKLISSKNDNLFVELNILSEIQDKDLEYLNTYDCLKNKCKLTTSFIKYNSPSSLAKCTSDKCQKYTIYQNSCVDNTVEALQIRYDKESDTLQYCDEYKHFSPITSDINTYINLNNNQSFIKVKPNIVGLSQYSLTLPICSSVNNNSSCKTGINEKVETCIDSKGRIYKNRFGKCFLYYGYTNNKKGIMIFQKGSNPNNFFDVTKNMNNIVYNTYEIQPFFVIYECFNNKCLQTSGLIRYTIKNSIKKNPDEFVGCFIKNSNGCQKIEYASSDECSGTQSHPNEGKILFNPALSSTIGELQICMDTEGKAIGDKKLRFVKIITNYITENYFAMIIGQTSIFPDTVPTQKVFMKVTYNAIIISQGFRLHQMRDNKIYILDIMTTKPGYYWGSNNAVINCNKSIQQYCEPITISNPNCGIVGTLTKDSNNNYKYCIQSQKNIDLPDDTPHYYPIILNQSYSYATYVTNIPITTSNGLLNVTRTSITQVTEKEIYINSNYENVSIEEFERCDSSIKKYQCNSNGYCYISSCCNVEIDDNCESDYYIYDQKLFNCIETPDPEKINYSCSKPTIKDNYIGIKVFKKNKNNDILYKINRFEKLIDEDIPYILLYDCAKAKCIPTSGYIRYNNNNSLAKCTINQCEKIENPYLSTCEEYAVSSNDECGPTHNNTICNNGNCCDSNGKCGTETTFCNIECLSEFGKCRINNTLYNTYNIIQTRIEQSKFQFCNRNHVFNDIEDNGENFYIIEDGLSFAKTEKNIIALTQNSLNLPNCYSTNYNSACLSNVNTYVKTCISNNIIYTNNEENKCVDTYGIRGGTGIKIFQKGTTSFEFTDVTNNLKNLKSITNELNPFFLIYNCTSSECKHYTSNYRFDISDTIENEFICYEKENACYLLKMELEYNLINDENHNNESNAFSLKYLLSSELYIILFIYMINFLYYQFII
ncbi:hypothetical protein PIROE2DRAFT_62316 [Piromyces sp. E2]|nr:hypothetical protein PIROE2DRAFT_62316 [Piromyces sp. E2]|eukprot:OUM61727.1 hypothetical protein PIROE2DRAFT_62316 [Piromyces sp. E2]